MDDKKLLSKRVGKARQCRKAMLDELGKIAEDSGANIAVFEAMEGLKELIYWLELWQCQLQPKGARDGK